MNRHTTRLVAAAFALTLLPVVAQTQSKQPAKEPPAAQNPMPVVKKYGEVGGWTINSATLDGQHMSCAAVVPAESGVKAAFEITSEGTTMLVATTTKGAEGDESKGAYDIDGKTTRIPFYRRENDRNMGFFKEAQAKQVAAGKAKVLTVTIGAEKTVIPLTGIDAALKRAVECDEKQGK